MSADDGAIDLGELSETERAVAADLLSVERRIRRSQLWKQMLRVFDDEQEAIDLQGANDALTLEQRAMLQVRASYLRVLRLQLPRRVAEREHDMRTRTDDQAPAAPIDDGILHPTAVPDLL
jgi:hypothetical protein